MKKYIYIGLACLTIVVVLVLLVSIACDVYYVIHPSPVTSIYASHVTALKLFAIAALCLIVGVIMRLLKV